MSVLNTSAERAPERPVMDRMMDALRAFRLREQMVRGAAAAVTEAAERNEGVLLFMDAEGVTVRASASVPAGTAYVVDLLNPPVDVHRVDGVQDDR